MLNLYNILIINLIYHYCLYKLQNLKEIYTLSSFMTTLIGQHISNFKKILFQKI